MSRLQSGLRGGSLFSPVDGGGSGSRRYTGTTVVGGDGFEVKSGADYGHGAQGEGGEADGAQMEDDINAIRHDTITAANTAENARAPTITPSPPAKERKSMSKPQEQQHVESGEKSANSKREMTKEKRRSKVAKKDGKEKEGNSEDLAMDPTLAGWTPAVLGGDADSADSIEFNNPAFDLNDAMMRPGPPSMAADTI